MCSFIFSTKPIPNIEEANFYTQLRGPDVTTSETINGMLFLHNLLSITGSFTKQPIIEDDIIVLFNGEIYNFGNYDNDTKCIIPLYKEHGPEFTKMLDGEFSIVLVDIKQKKILISSDTFKTKPLFFAIDNGEMGAASYSTPLNHAGFSSVQKFPPNTTMVFDLETKKVIQKFEVVKFDLNQHKNTFDDWNVSFSESIKKRSKDNIRESIFIGLSSGYDSGAIACEMKNIGVSFKGYTHIGSENRAILNNRSALLSPQSNVDQYTTNPSLLSTSRDYIVRNTEPFMYTIHSDRSGYNEYDLKLVDDNGSIQFSYLCNKAKNDGYKIHMSGAGADELFSDYGFGGKSKYNHSNFGGLFPRDLSAIFPWASFYGSSMESYLAKEEYVGGSYGIESRYPFMDKKVVQEFLWITHDLKNKYYKNVLHNYLTNNNFPFCSGEKIGF